MSSLLGPLARIVLLVRDFAQSVEFYERVLNLPKTQEHPGWAVFRTGDLLLCLRGPWEDMAFDPATFGQSPDELLFLVPDIEAARESLQDRGIDVDPIHEPGPGLRVAAFHDPDGRRLALEERRET